MSRGAPELLGFLLEERPAPRTASDVVGFVRSTASLRARFGSAVDRAVAQGFVSDRVAFAFLAGYEAALQAMVPSLPIDEIASFCVTEEAGNHPRAIATTLEPQGSAFVLRGAKKWSTAGPVAHSLLVVAREGVSSDGRPSLRAVRVPAGAPGLTVTAMPEAPFVPEVPHAGLVLDGVVVPVEDVLLGDGYVDYTKAFRTLEDLHVNAALMGYLLSLALRFSWPEELSERLALLVLAARSLGAASARSPGAHVALAGLVASLGALVSEATPWFERLPEPERGRWHRDQALFHVAAKAREQRRVRAWEVLRGSKG